MTTHRSLLSSDMAISRHIDKPLTRHGITKREAIFLRLSLSLSKVTDENVRVINTLQNSTRFLRS